MQLKNESMEQKRSALIRLLGLAELTAQKRCSLNPRTIWMREYPFGRVEKVSFQTEPGVYTCAYVCLPFELTPPYRAFICLQGHTTGMHTSIGMDWRDEVTPVHDDGDREFALGCLKRGIPAVCLEQRAMGENSGDPERRPACYMTAMTALLAGRTLLGMRVWDVKRLLDYLGERGDFDLSRIGIMGNSGGGTTAMFAGAVLPELTHVMPSCSFSTFRDSIGSIRHCTCNYVPGLYQFGESADVLGLIAPRPLVIVNGAKDDIFPIEAAKSEFARLKEMYESAGAGEYCKHVVGPEGHRFYADSAWDVMLPMWEKQDIQTDGSGAQAPA